MIEGLPVNELALKAWFYTTIFLIWHEIAVVKQFASSSLQPQHL